MRFSEFLIGIQPAHEHQEVVCCKRWVQHRSERKIQKGVMYRYKGMVLFRLHVFRYRVGFWLLVTEIPGN